MTGTVAIIDYGSGNLRSAAKAFERSARALKADAEIAVTNDPDVVRKADRIVLPGVGAFEDCMNGLNAVAACARRWRSACQRAARRSSASASACS